MAKMKKAAEPKRLSKMLTTLDNFDSDKVTESVK